MSHSILLSQLVTILAATPIHLTPSEQAKPAVGITTDTRTLEPGQMFLALRGERFDGHDFVEAAFAAGAVAAIVDQQYTSQNSKHPLLQVKDTLVAYQEIGAWWRSQLSIPVVAVTGSVGKTTTKELIAAVLGLKGNVLKTQANYNNEIGVPKTLLEVTPEHDYAVIEMGMRGRGEIARLSQIARPDIAVITNVGTAHIERLGSELAIAQAKCELLAEMPPTSVAILNQDNPLLMETAAQVWSGKTVTFGLEGGDICADLLDNQTLSFQGMTLPLPLPGRHNALNYLAALAVAQTLNLDLSCLTAGLTVQLPAGRARRYDLPNDIILLDETYNAGLESMTAALHLLVQTPGKRHIAVLGTMRELGAYSSEYHRQVGAVVQQLKLERLLILASEPEAGALAAGAAPVPAEIFTTHESVVARLVEIVESGDRLLFKASRAVELDRVVEAFLRALQP
ncbi:UDP-N-acetylmuramoyl-tripeptide--D-alanyl-D-alanine ligase [Leptolyngbya sp. 'hensonii']|uniref:UDP-N-acetylmuramoyl-tripeptide--D-alanyl-D- alanine ligase n=1 Tax=Leptolyngbya sp. 'hensonii' TaxID=1922337 RepID=UPI00094FE737|nr:UDP-N-acetylmuramoyl-tripeptide--D-alanyl-D-alanine ligase [Leptolyngbya sp. 'hensonii']OLP19051.1 UDP-N-acetylmuramoyl-tripeptide--D-alanyl-D-alanine ligase [Leptolyngbya sp. 'hensonii']